ncbi:hypothetical protein GGR57DRAFT_94582 [Xylariaceae sp. FL1272]|nr:hypothetical protein GGR57DRAFT_94582 [Xylariaceae sp. FL1272]
MHTTSPAVIYRRLASSLVCLTSRPAAARCFFTSPKPEFTLVFRWVRLQELPDDPQISNRSCHRKIQKRASPVNDMVRLGLLCRTAIPLPPEACQTVGCS